MKAHTLVAALLLTSLAASPVAGQDREPEPRGWLGISFEPGPADDGSVTVEEVARGTPAEQAGIEPGDRITRWNGRPDVRQAVRERRLAVGDTVRLRVSRPDGSDRDLALVAERFDSLVERIVTGDGDVIVLRPGEVLRRARIASDSMVVHLDSLQARVRVLLRDSLGPRLREIEDELRETRIEIVRRDSLRSRFDGTLGMAIAGGRSSVAGAMLADVTPGLGSYFGAEEGALVLRIAPSTPAADAGLAEGDVIVRAGRQEVGGVADLRETLERLAPGATTPSPRIFLGRDRADDPTAPAAQRPRPRIYVDGARVDDAPREIPLEILRRGERYSITLRL